MHLRADFRPPQFGENFWHAGLAFGASFALFAALNLVVTGIPEPRQGANPIETDRNAIDAVLAAAGCPGIAPAKVSRLGKRRVVDATNENARPPRPRPIMVSLDTAADTRQVMDNCKKLAEVEAYKKVYIKRDTHPLIRKEWGRLRSLVKTEKEAPINQGCEIKLDYKNKVVTRDGTIIARFQSPFPQ